MSEKTTPVEGERLEERLRQWLHATCNMGMGPRRDYIAPELWADLMELLFTVTTPPTESQGEFHPECVIVGRDARTKEPAILGWGQLEGNEYREDCYVPYQPNESQGELVALAEAFLNPEAFGWTVTKEVRDRARLALGMNRVETLQPKVDRLREGIYIASKTRHAERWKTLRRQGIPVISTWIDEAGPGESSCLSDLWLRCIKESANAKALIVYAEPEDILKGAFIETGSAIASGVPVFAVGIDDLSICNHPGVTVCQSFEVALRTALADSSGSSSAVPSAEASGLPQSTTRGEQE